jgi:iron-sulfur cluster assembly protein
MGTFHDTSDPLHGVTVVAEIGKTVYVGRCHERDDQKTMLVGVDIHEEDASGKGSDGRTNQEFLDRAAKFGIWSTHEKVVLDTPDISNLIPLNEYYAGPGAKAATRPAAKPAPAATGLQDIKSAAPSAGEEPVTLTDSATEEVRRLLAEEGHEGKGLRLGVSGGGCSGLVYKVEFDEQAEGDLVVAHDGFEVYLDRKSTIYLRGVTLDYEKGLSGRGFQFSNPNASNTCGCGESFSV